MNVKVLSVLVGTCVGLSVYSGTASANLLGRLASTPGGTDYQAYYDDVLDITWLANANLASVNTFGLPTDTDLGMHPDDIYTATIPNFSTPDPNDTLTIDTSYPNLIGSDGRMTWGATLHWLDAMNADNGSGYLGFNDWRLPTMVDTGAPGCDYSIDDTDCGYNVQTGSAATGVFSEMGSLWYDTLGNLGRFDRLDNINTQPGFGFANTGPFTNLPLIDPNTLYWTNLEDAQNQNHRNAWFFSVDDGLQRSNDKNRSFYTFVVRSGDVGAGVSAVPVPAAVWLFGSGLLGLAAVARKRPQ